MCVSVSVPHNQSADVECQTFNFCFVPQSRVVLVDLQENLKEWKENFIDGSPAKVWEFWKVFFNATILEGFFVATHKDIGADEGCGVEGGEVEEVQPPVRAQHGQLVTWPE